MMDQAAAEATPSAQNTACAALDRYLGDTVAYIPLDGSRFHLLHGSSVTNDLVDRQRTCTETSACSA
jgi:hypothetical protein